VKGRVAFKNRFFSAKQGKASKTQQRFCSLLKKGIFLKGIIKGNYIDVCENENEKEKTKLKKKHIHAKAKNANIRTSI
jgi:hypothetical protein